MPADLHRRLLDEIADLEAVRTSMPGEVLATVRAVIELHKPRPCAGMAELCAHLDPHNVCTTCGSSGQYVIGEPDSTAHCSTVRTIAQHLGINHGEHHG